jgi:RND family efflux transporter MFP subunit
MRLFSLPLVLCLAAMPAEAKMLDTLFTVTDGMITDQTAVFATVESTHVAAARTRLGGTVIILSVRAGDDVSAGQTIAEVADSTLAEQLNSIDADISGLRAQLDQAKMDLARDQQLIASGAISRSVVDQAQTAVNVNSSGLISRIAARAALAQQIANGGVLAPVSGRVLQCAVTQGTVVLSGDTIATIAEQNYVLRLEVPEHHAVLLKPGDEVRLEPDHIGSPTPVFGKITLVYPQIENGRVEVDATAPDLGNYFVGQRIQVWLYAGERPGMVIPAKFIKTSFGLDYVNVRESDGGIIAVPVQRGAPQPTTAMPDGLEILSGLHAGDVLALPSTTVSP